MSDVIGSSQASQDLRIVDLTKRFGTATAVDDITLTVPAGSFFALLGPSGCGKTTTLRMVAGLEDPTSGSVYLGDDDVTYRKPYKRPVNTVFQNYALFPHLDVYDNVAFGLRRRGIKGVDKQVTEMLELVELAGYGGRKPAQLSGGQQQRVALARALINRPQVLLLDEPLGALDLKLRRQMQLELKRIQTEVGITFVHVTHDQEEAMTMADTIAVMNGGKVEQLGAPEDLYENPSTVFVANFLGQSNLLTATVTGQSGEDLLLDVAGNRLTMPARRRGTGGDTLYVGIRPEKVRLRHGEDPADSAARNEVAGVITDSSFTGVSTQYLVRTGWGQELMVFAPNLEHDPRLRPGAPVVLSWNPAHTFGLEATGDLNAGVDDGVLGGRVRSAGLMTAAVTEQGERNRRRRRNTPYWLLLPGLGFLLIFFVVPIVTLAFQSLYTGDIYAGYSLTWHWHTYADVFSSYHEQFIRSFEYAGMATVAALVISYPLAYVIAFKSGRFKNLLLVLVVAPFFVSFLVRTLAWQSILADDGYIADALRTLHLLSADGRLINTPFAVVCGLTYNFLPFMTLPLYASLEKIDVRLISAAADLYAGPTTAFRKVTFPLSLPGVVAGTLLTFIPAAGDFVNVEFLGDPLHQMIGNVIEKRFLVQTDYPAASALSVLLMAAIIVLVIAYTRRAGTEEIV